LSELLRKGRTLPESEGIQVQADLRADGSNSRHLFSDPDFPLQFAVYNRYYVDASLKVFLDGEGSTEPIPIVQVGEESVNTEIQIRSIQKLIEARQTWQSQAQNVISEARQGIKDIERSVKSLVISALRPGAADIYNSTAYNVSRVRKNIENTSSSDYLQEEELAYQIAKSSEEVRSPVELPFDFPSAPRDLASRLLEAVTRVVESAAVEDLANNKTLADWTEDGLTLHKPGDQCRFCRSGIVSDDLISIYRSHFSNALNDLRAQLTTLKGEIEQEIEEVKTWFEELPNVSQLLLEHQGTYSQKVDLIKAHWQRALINRENLIGLIDERIADPLWPLDGSNNGLNTEVLITDAAELISVLKLNNDGCDSQMRRQDEARRLVERHFAVEAKAKYEEQQKLLSRARNALGNLQRNLNQLHEEKNELRNSLQDTGPMASRIDHDLKYHFGHTHLSVAQTQDGKGYIIKRGTEYATDLSEGERNSIAYLYFLASLESDSIDKSQTVVVIDDPVTSLDRESMFAAFGLHTVYLSGFAQTIFLTHDFEFFRLQANHLKSRYEVSQKKIRENNKEESSYPRVSILEIKASINEEGKRSSKLKALSRELLLHSSEYHYLFYKVAKAIESKAEDEYPLLGNAARRLVEGFAAFQAPQRITFGERINEIACDNGIEQAHTQRVVKFMHGQSHRTSPNPVTGLEIPAYEDELRAVLSFMRKADRRHFANMCKAVNVSPSNQQLVAG